jgi:hypothetical protein
MIKKSLIIGMISVSMIGMSQTQCNGLTKDSVQCKNITKSKTKLCYLHDKTYKKDDKMSQRCKGMTKKNKRCKNKTKNTNKLCYRHEKK